MKVVEKAVELSQIVANAAKWMDSAIERTDYGEVAVVVKLHAGRVPIVEYTQSTKIKTDEPHTGSTGASRERRHG